MTSTPDLRDRASRASARTDSTPGNAEVATREEPQRSLASMIVALKPELAHALPRHVSVDRVARIAVTALRRTPKLNACTPESFLGALMTASQLGLEVNTPAGEAYLIPYGKECTLVVGYQGIVKLFWQHPQAKHIDAQAVYEADEFSYAYGLAPNLTHKPATGADRGKVIAYYAVATLQSGGSAFVVLTPDQVKELRQGKVGPSGDIKDPQRWMERKTALKQMLKLLPKTVELTAAIAADEQVRTDYTSSLDAIETRAPAELGGAGTIDAVAEPVADAGTPDVDGQPVTVADATDGCPGCGEVGVVHTPLDCPSLAGSETVEEPQG